MEDLRAGSRLELLARRWGLLDPPFAYSRRWVSRLFLHGPDVRTLDLGCGEGYFTLAAARLGGYALGISNDPRALGRATGVRDLMGVPAERAEFRNADLRTWRPGPGEQYDQILLLSVLEHVQDDAGLLRRAHSALKPDGLLFVSAPNRACGLREKRPHVIREETGGHLRHGYTFEQLEALLACCGYEAVDRRGLGWLGTQTLAQLERSLAFSRLARAAGRVLLFPLAKPMAGLLDLMPVGEPYLVLITARKAESA
jgi:SAM-dependent methyltransferase